MPSSKTSSKKPSNKWFGKFARQELPPKWKPIPSKNWTIGSYLVASTCFVALGAVFLIYNLQIEEIRERYDDKGEFADMGDSERFSQLVELNTAGELGDEKRTVSFTVTAKNDMEPPVYVFYEISEFYQNHKRYVRSLSSQQLGGQNPGAARECSPKRILEGTEEHPVNGTGLIVPCGLVAASYFNDSYSVEDANGPIIINEENISWKWDRDHLYGDVEPDNFNPEWQRGGKTISGPINKDEHFMVWMRVSASPTARKLYGRIEKKIVKGTTLTFTAKNNYNTYKFGGKKYIILTTSNWTGGRNILMGILYIVVGCLCAIAGISVFLLDHYTKRPVGDLSALSWIKKQS